MKNFVNLLFIATLLLISCSQNEELEITNKAERPIGNVSRLQLGEKVKLIKVSDQNYLACSRNGCSNFHEREYIVEVANVAFNKKVQIHQQLSNGQWEDYDLAFAYFTSNGNEIWKGKNIKNYNSPDHNAKYFGEQLAVKYSVNNTTYWDNNNNNNYFINYTNRPIGYKTLYLVNSLNVLNQFEINSLHNDGSKSYFNVGIELRNITFAKDVKIFYTTNNWTISSSFPLTFVHYNFYLNNEFENWNGNFEIPKTQKVSYYFSYKVNGVTYYDNNFGNNYTITSSN